MSGEIRASYLFLPWYAPDVLYAAFFISGAVMIYGLFRHLARYGLEPKEFAQLVTRDLSTKVRRFVDFGIEQRRVLSGGEGGAMHGAIFFGFLMLLAYTTLIFIQSDILPLFTTAVFLQGGFYLTLEFLGDTLGLAFVVGLGLLVWIGLSGFGLETLRFVALPAEATVYAPVGQTLSFIAAGIVSPAGATSAYQALWFAHMFSVFGLIALVPYTKLAHVFTSGANVAVADQKPMGRLSTPFKLQAMMESGSLDAPPNVKSSADFTPLQRLALDACTNCGRCQEVCPAYASGRDLSPRVVVQDLGRELKAGGADSLSTGVIREQELWSCTTCNACVNVCPVLIDQVDYIVEFRRTLVAENRLDPLKRAFLQNIASNNNPFGLPQGERQTWLTDMGVPTLKENPGAEYVYWVGCQGSYDPRARKITASVVEVLRAGKVDFAILGNEEVCTGEPVRRMGEEARFQELALRNIETLKGAGTRKVVVHCAHCFNTFLNEYPELGAKFEVIHHSQLIWELVKEGRIAPGASSGRTTFHDPCNLGRINGVFEEPRQVLESMPGAQLVEMKRNRSNGFCCGGGGANSWYQVPEKRKRGEIRLEEAIATGADTVAVGCPFCVAIFEDAAKSMGKEDLAVKDIAEIVAERLRKA
jgi:Fe-S oxidoreductase